MSERQFSVIVVPDAWSESLEGLARVVAPMTSVRPQQLVPVLRRGPMTLDADLSREEADRLFDRLASLDVPSRVVDGDNETVREVEATSQTVEESTRGDSDAEDIDSVEPDEGWDAFLGDADVEDLEVPEPTETSSPLDIEQTNAPTLDELESGDDAQENKRQRSSTMLGAPGPSSTFGAEVARADEHDGKPGESSADTGDAERFGPPSEGDADADEQPPELEPPTSKQAPPQIPSRGVDGADGTPEPPADGRDDASDAPPIGSMAEAGFDASRLDAALEADSERPPYAPEGFDDRGEHIPALAAILSLVAPGAGQTYNGEAEKSWQFGTRFALLLPWYKSVRQAWERAEQIRTYYAPRPSEGAFVRALKYAASWWIIVGGVVALLGFGGVAGYNAFSRPERPRVTEADIQSAHDEARRQVMLARIGGLDGVSRHLDERDESQDRFTMSEEERVERLFRRGYQSCRAREYSTCQAVMKRVSSLSPKYRREAYKLQAWASMQGSTDTAKEPMPDVDIDSLEAFETAGGPDTDENDDAEPGDDDTGDGEAQADNQAPNEASPGDGDEAP